MATFHPFPRLPIELRIHIWGFATEDRVLKVRKIWIDNHGYWSPTPVPAVNRACRESRDHCSYRKAFIIDSSPRYIWANFDCDVIQLRNGLLVERNPVERDEIWYLRIELVDEQGLDESNFFYHSDVHKLRDFPKLESFDLLVSDGLCSWTGFIKETYWGACPSGNVRIVDAETGMWIDEETNGLYQDYIDTGMHDDYTRVMRTRIEAVKRLQITLLWIAM